MVKGAGAFAPDLAADLDVDGAGASTFFAGAAPGLEAADLASAGPGATANENAHLQGESHISPL